MLGGVVIVPGTSAWSLLVVIATRKDGKRKFCAQYWFLNQVPRTNRQPSPKIEEVLDRFVGYKVFTTLFSRYRKIEIDKRCREHTTFFIHTNTYQLEVMPLRLVNAPPTFQRMMAAVLKDVYFVQAYLDSVVLHSKAIDVHMSHLQIDFALMNGHQLKINVLKCKFTVKSGESPLCSELCW